jgi:hypothetical protein
MDRREDQVILVERRYARLSAALIGGVKGQFGQEPLTRSVAGGNLLKLIEISDTRCRIIVKSL